MTLISFEVLLCTDNCLPGMLLHNSTCTICPAGRSSVAFNSTACDVFYSGSDQLTCAECPAGKYSDSIEQAECLPCEVGKFSSTKGKTFCEQCPPPTVLTTTQGATSSSDCLGCFDGYSLHNSSCMPCGQGKFGLNSNCFDCERGKYSAATGVSMCQNCPDGTFLNSSGADSIDRCKICPQGSSCEPGSIIPNILNGWYRNINENAELVLQCFPSQACPEGGNGSTICAQGYK
jgi:hypothetical protein